MSAVWEIARLRLLQNIRRQVHLITVFMAFGMLMLPAYVNAFSMGLQAFELVAKDFGLTIISYYGVALAIGLGATAVSEDLERKTIYPLLSRPLGRLSYLAGQVLGLGCLVWSSLFLLTAALQLGIFSLSRHFDWQMFGAALGYSLEASIVLAASLCFSMFASPPLAGVLGFALYLIGGLSAAFIQFFIRDDRGSNQLAGGLEWLKRALPNFEIFRLKYPVAHGFHIDPRYFGAISFYALAWILVFLMVAELRFRRRDL